MRIRKRTPARAASPGPGPALSAPPPPPPPVPLQQPKEKPQEEVEEEKRVILIAGVRGHREEEEDDPAPAATCSEDSSAADDAPKPEPQDASAARCSRNDGKRWRCKSAAAPGYLFCDRHIAWSTRKRKPRAKKLKNHTIPKDEAPRLGRNGRGDGFFGGFQFQQGCRGERAKDGGPGPAA